MDSTPYSPEMHPEVSLRQIFHECKLPENFRVKLAGQGVVETVILANIAEDLPNFKVAISTFFTEDDLGTGAARVVNMSRLGSVWQAARAHVEQTCSARTKMMENPLVIPELPMRDFNEYRNVFKKNHPDWLLSDFREPNKRFVERVIRDLSVHLVVPAYELGEIRLRSETIVQTSGLAQTPEHLLQVAKIDQPVSVSMEEDAVSRIHALYMTLEYLGVVGFELLSSASGTSHGGPLTYMQELEKRRRETPGLAFVVIADKKIRGKVYELTTERREEYPNYSAAMRAVLTEYRDLWADARSECRQPEQVVSQESKRARQADTAPVEAEGKRLGKKARQTANRNEKIAALQDQLKQLQPGEAARVDRVPSGSRTQSLRRTPKSRRVRSASSGTCRPGVRVGSSAPSTTFVPCARSTITTVGWIATTLAGETLVPRRPAEKGPLVMCRRPRSTSVPARIAGPVCIRICQVPWPPSSLPRQWWIGESCIGSRRRCQPKLTPQFCIRLHLRHRVLAFCLQGLHPACRLRRSCRCPLLARPLHPAHHHLRRHLFFMSSTDCIPNPRTRRRFWVSGASLWISGPPRLSCSSGADIAGIIVGRETKGGSISVWQQLTLEPTGLS